MITVAVREQRVYDTMEGLLLLTPESQSRPGGHMETIAWSFT